MQVLAGDIASAFNLLLVFTYRSELRIRYPAILERASLSCGAGWAELLDALCAPTKERRRQDGVAGRLQMRRFSALIKRLDKAFGKFYVGEDAVDEINCY